MKKIITIASKGLFKDRNFIQARPLTLDDFTITTMDTKVPTTLEDFRRINIIYHTVTGTLKDVLVQELNDIEFFRQYGNSDINEMSEGSIETLISSAIDIGEPIRLGTKKGVSVKSLANKLELTDKAKAKLDSRVADGLAIAKFVEEKINHWNERIEYFIKEHNASVEKEIRINLTNRSSLIDIIDLNKNGFDKAETKVLKTFDKNVELINAHIETLKVKLGALEVAKSMEYIKLSQCVYADELKEIPEDIRKDIEVHYSNGSTFG